MLTEANKRISRRADEELFNRGNLSVATELFTPDFLYHAPGGQPLRGPQGIVQFVQLFRTAFPDLHLQIEEQFAEDDLVAYRWTARGTHLGELMGIPATGNPVRITGIAIARLTEGQIAEIWEHYDGLGLMQQLGAIPAAPQAPAREVVAPGRGTQDACAERNKALLLDYTAEVWNGGNLDAIERYIADDFLRHQSGWPQELRGPGAVHDSITRELSAFADLRVITEALVAEGDTVAMRLRLTATHTGDLFGIPPTGKTVAIDSLHLYRFADGKIVEQWLEADMLGLLRQIGAIPTPV